jgi:TolB-like protein
MKRHQMLLVVVLLFASSFLSLCEAFGGPESAAASKRLAPIVCVSQFEARGELAESRHLASAIVEEVRHFLITSDQVQVTSSDCATSESHFFRLEGSVSSEGERLRVAATLYSSIAQQYTWSEIFDRQVDAEIDDVAREIATAVVNAASASSSPLSSP